MNNNIEISDEGVMTDDIAPHRPGEQPTLHEILVAEKLDFEAKVQRAARRKKWLKGKLTETKKNKKTKQKLSYLLFVLIFLVKFNSIENFFVIY